MISTRIIRSTHSGNFTPHPFSGAEVLRRLYREQLEQRPADDYLRQHGQPAFLDSTARVFRFYESYLPSTGRVLDWGCHHAPNACLIRVRHPELEVDGCDVFEADDYPVFFQFARLRYQRLRETVRLPYADATFDAAVASGVPEHVPMDYESLKEIYRVLRPEGRLVVTYLPNRASVEEWSRRRQSREPHVRLYSLSGLRGLLLHTGFVPLVIGTKPGWTRSGKTARWLGSVFPASIA